MKMTTIIINIPIDTLEVLKDYYAKNVYIDEIISRFFRSCN